MQCQTACLRESPPPPLCKPHSPAVLQPPTAENSIPCQLPTAAYCHLMHARMRGGGGILKQPCIPTPPSLSCRLTRRPLRSLNFPLRVPLLLSAQLWGCPGVQRGRRFGWCSQLTKKNDMKFPAGTAQPGMPPLSGALKAPEWKGYVPSAQVVWFCGTGPHGK